MMIGQITANREAVIELEVVGSEQRKEKVEAVIDTGFNGYLTLPGDMVSRLKLQLAGNRRAILGDGNTVVLDVYLPRWYGIATNAKYLFCKQEAAR